MGSAPDTPPRAWKADTREGTGAPAALCDAHVQQESPYRRRVLGLLAPLAVVALVLLAFTPVLRNDFVGWDDDQNLLLNTHYRGLKPANLRWMFTSFLLGHYQPLSWISFGLDYLLWGMNPTGYHLTNLLLHAANTLLVYLLAQKLLLLALTHPVPAAARSSGAALAAALFALHPLRVESVAWVTQRRDVLGSFFYLLAVLAYLRAQGEGRRGRWLAAGLGAMFLSLLSKATAVTLPAVLLVLDAHPLRRLAGAGERRPGPSVRRVLVEKVPFLVLAATGAVVAVTAQAHSRALEPLSEYGPGQRLAQACYGLAFYLYKSLLPVSLSPLYEVPVRFDPLAGRYLLSGLFVAVLTPALVSLRRRWPDGLAAWVCYVAVLSPVLGTFQSGRQFVADRYTYLPCVGWCVLAGGGLIRLWSLASRAGLSGSAGRAARWLFGVLAGAGIGSLLSLTRAQTLVWSDSETLWRHVLSIDPSSPTGHDNLGVALLDRGDLEAAIAEHRQAQHLRPDDPQTCHRLAYALARAGRPEEAIRMYRQALANDTGHVPSRINLANLLDRLGRVDEAIEQLEEVVRTAPRTPDAAFHLGELLRRKSRFSEAIRVWRAGLEATPDHVEMTVQLAALLTTCPEASFRDPREALRLADRACRLTGNGNPKALLAKGAALGQLGRWDEAVAALGEALDLARSQGDETLVATAEGLLREYRSQGRR